MLKLKGRANISVIIYNCSAYPKITQLLNNLSLKSGDQNNLGPVSKSYHVKQGHSWCSREDIELLPPVLWREVEHPQRWMLTNKPRGKNPLTFTGNQLMLQSMKSDYNYCLRVELHLL